MHCTVILYRDYIYHYNYVKKDRRVKGIIAIVLGYIFGIITYNLVKDKMTTTDKKIKQWSIIFIVVSGTRFLLYNLMWQNNFIFEPFGYLSQKIYNVNYDFINNAFKFAPNPYDITKEYKIKNYHLASIPKRIIFNKNTQIYN